MGVNEDSAHTFIADKDFCPQLVPSGGDPSEVFDICWWDGQLGAF